MRFAAVFSLLFAGLISMRAAERDIVRTFPVASGCTVSVDTFRGAITVKEGETNQVRVAVHLEIGADTDAEADQMLDALRLEIVGDGPVIRVRASDPQQTRPRFVWNEKKQIEPTYRITVPPQCNLDLKTRRGPVTVGNIAGNLRAHTGAGDVFFRTVGGQVNASTDKGDIVVSRCEGSLDAHTSIGGIRLGTVTGPCNVRTDSGDVEVMAAKGDLTAHAEAGGISVDFPRDFEGTAHVETNGGGIVASIDPAANVDVTASASILAHVENKLPLLITSGRSGARGLTGRLNRGGHRIVIHASGGNVRLVRGDSPFEDGPAG